MIDLQRTMIVIDKVLDGMKYKNGTVVVKDVDSVFKAENVRFEAICLYDGDMNSIGYCTEHSWISPSFTNEDWLGQMTLNEKAKFLKEISFCCNTCSPEQFEAYKNGKFKCPLKMACATANGFEDWLKENHHEV